MAEPVATQSMLQDSLRI